MQILNPAVNGSYFSVDIFQVTFISFLLYFIKRANILLEYKNNLFKNLQSLGILSQWYKYIFIDEKSMALHIPLNRIWQLSVCFI